MMIIMTSSFIIIAMVWGGAWFAGAWFAFCSQLKVGVVFFCCLALWSTDREREKIV